MRAPGLIDLFNLRETRQNPFADPGFFYDRAGYGLLFVCVRV